MTAKRLTALSFLAIGAAIAPGAAKAQTCQPGNPQDSLQYLRRLSLDLRGRVPDYAELEQVAMSNTVDPALIDQMIASNEFLHQVDGIHRDMFWTNITDQRLAGPTFTLRPPATSGAYPTPAYYIASATRQIKYRSAQVGCLDEAARFDPTTGAILTTATLVPAPGGGSMVTAHQEGWVMVAPYWNPQIQVKVCAFDAQSARMVTDGGRRYDCSTSAASALCGCGPNLDWCESRTDGTSKAILDSMDQQLLRFAREVVTNDRPYTDLITAKDMDINGPIVHYLKYQYFAAGAQGILATPSQSYALPSLTFDQADTWVKVTRTGNDAGVETMPAYLLRFQSDRGRANRFYNAFFGRYYQAGMLPPGTDAQQGCDNTNPDITKRCFCKDCHAGPEGVESLAAYFGRVGEAALVPLDPSAFPANDPSCATGRGVNCLRFYITSRDIAGMTDSPLEPYVGWLRAYAFADDARKRHIEDGPPALARVVIDQNLFAPAITKRLWSRFMGHDPTDADQSTLDRLAQGFANGYRLKDLVKAIVETPQYIEGTRFKAMSN
jgi:uncharacterized protein DUF1585